MNKIKFIAILLMLVFTLACAACGAEGVDTAEKPVESAAPMEESFTTLTDVEALAGVSELCQGENGTLKMRTTARGMESDIVLEVCIDADGNIAAIELISHNETPNLGGAALEGEYLQSYVGSDVDSVDAYSGATYTSDAIKNCLKLAQMQYKAVNGIEFEAPKTTDELLTDALIAELGTVYEEVTGEFDSAVLAVYQAGDNYAVYVEGIGHEAEHPMKLLVVIDGEKKVKNIVVLEHTETAGIGANVLEQKNLCFYYGGKHFTMIDMGDDTKIDIVSGATETSFGVMKLVNAACETVSTLS